MGIENFSSGYLGEQISQNYSEAMYAESKSAVSALNLKKLILRKRLQNFVCVVATLIAI